MEEKRRSSLDLSFSFGTGKVDDDTSKGSNSDDKPIFTVTTVPDEKTNIDDSPIDETPVNNDGKKMQLEVPSDQVLMINASSSLGVENHGTHSSSAAAASARRKKSHRKGKLSTKLPMIHRMTASTVAPEDTLTATIKKPLAREVSMSDGNIRYPTGKVTARTPSKLSQSPEKSPSNIFDPKRRDKKHTTSVHFAGDGKNDDEQEDADEVQQQLAIVQGDTDDEDLMDLIVFSPSLTGPGKAQDDAPELLRSWSTFGHNLGKRFLIFFILSVVLLVPGFVCEYAVRDACFRLQNTLGVLAISIFVIVFMFCYLLSMIVEQITSSIIHAIRPLAVRYAYYTAHLRTPSRLFFWYIIFFFSWTLFLKPTLEEGVVKVVSTFERTLSILGLVFSVGFVVRAIAMRYLAINYHRGAYLNRIKNAIFVEYIFSKMIRYLEYAELMIRDPHSGDPNSHVTNASGLFKFGNVSHASMNRHNVADGSGVNGNVRSGFFSRIFRFGARSNPNQASSDTNASMSTPLPRPNPETNPNYPNSVLTTDDSKSIYERVVSFLLAPEPPLPNNNIASSINRAFASYSSNTISIGSQKIGEKDLITGKYSTYQLSDLIEYLKRNVTLKSYASSLKILQQQAAESNESVPVRESLRKIGAVLFERLIILRNMSNAIKTPTSKTTPMTETNHPFSHDGERDGEGIDVEEDVITEEDFYPLFQNPKLVKPAFLLLDANLDGSLTKAEFQTALVLIYKERKSLLKSLLEGEHAIGTLNSVITILLIMVMTVISLLLMGVEITGLMVTISSLFVSASFATGKSVERMVDSILFIFFFHPFDIGDRVVIKDQVYLVHRMTILTTELIRFDNTKVSFPNSMLLQLPISNYRRSPDQFDLITVEIDFSTPASKIQMFERRVKQFLVEHVEHYYKTFELELRDTQNQDKLFLRLWIQHRNNFQNMKRYRERRSYAIINIKQILSNLGIHYREPTVEVEFVKNTNNPLNHLVTEDANFNNNRNASGGGGTEDEEFYSRTFFGMAGKSNSSGRASHYGPMSVLHNPMQP